MADRTEYTRQELLADHEFDSRVSRGRFVFAGGLDSEENWISPRSAHRRPAIRAWTRRLLAEGHTAEVITAERIPDEVFPTVAQAKLLLRRGARGAMTRILTLVGITEGFGRHGIEAIPQLELQPYIKQSLAGTCVQHLNRGLLEAHGYDEAGSGSESGHDAMWYAVRDAALENPKITPDMYENLPLLPPPGYSGPAQGAPGAIGFWDMGLKFPRVAPEAELLLRSLAFLLAAEMRAYLILDWAKQILTDPECSASSEWAPFVIGCMQKDEELHIAYLQCTLAEIRCRTLIDLNGDELPAEAIVDAVCDEALDMLSTGPFRSVMGFQLNQVRLELADREDGARILAELASLGPIPEFAT